MEIKPNSSAEPNYPHAPGKRTWWAGFCRRRRERQHTLGYARPRNTQTADVKVKMGWKIRLLLFLMMLVIFVASCAIAEFLFRLIFA